MSGYRSVAAGIALAFLAGACGEGETPVASMKKIGTYSIAQGLDGLEIRSLPDQHPTLNRILGRLHPNLAQVGLPCTTLSPTRILDRGSLGNDTEWARAEVRAVTVQNRAKRGIEAKTQAADRSWRVLLVRKDGRPLRNGFGFENESDARAFAALVASALDTTPQDVNEPAAE